MPGVNFSLNIINYFLRQIRLFILGLFLCAGNFMARAFVLLNVEPGSEESVLKQLKKIGAVEEAYVSYGVYDLIALVKSYTMDELKDAVTHKIRTIDQVRTTLTLIMMEE
jgi:DNA-binding Lrp family transcriptional regulator